MLLIIFVLFVSPSNAICSNWPLAKNFENWDLASSPLPVGTPLAHIDTGPSLYIIWWQAGALPALNVGVAKFEDCAMYPLDLCSSAW